MLGGSGIGIRLYGEDLDDMRDTARAIAAKLALVDGVPRWTTASTTPAPNCILLWTRTRPPKRA